MSSRCVLTVLIIYAVNVERKLNAAAHHTSEYQTKKLVLRRGQIFTLKVILNRPHQPQDELKVTFTSGEAPAPAPGAGGRVGPKVYKCAMAKSDFDPETSASPC